MIDFVKPRNLVKKKAPHPGVHQSKMEQIRVKCVKFVQQRIGFPEATARSLVHSLLRDACNCMSQGFGLHGARKLLEYIESYDVNFNATLVLDGKRSTRPRNAAPVQSADLSPEVRRLQGLLRAATVRERSLKADAKKLRTSNECHKSARKELERKLWQVQQKATEAKQNAKILKKKVSSASLARDDKLEQMRVSVGQEWLQKLKLVHEKHALELKSLSESHKSETSRLERELKAAKEQLHDVMKNENDRSNAEAAAFAKELDGIIKEHPNIVHIVSLLDALAREGKGSVNLASLSTAFDEVSAKAVASFLFHNKTATSLSLARRGIGPEGMIIITRSISARNQSLAHLSLRNNNIGDAGAECLGRLLARDGVLQTLDVANNHISPNGVKFILDGVAANKALQMLDLSGNATAAKDAINTHGQMVGEALAVMLQTNKTLISLRINSMQWNTRVFQDLGNGLASNHSLASLSADHNVIGRASMLSLMQALIPARSTPRPAPFLSHLDLSSCSSTHMGSPLISGHSFSALGTLIEKNTSLTSLNLCNNDLQSDVIRDIAEALKTNASLTHINLGSNSIGPEGMKDLFEMLSINKALKRLNLSDNFLGTDAVMKALADALTSNHTLTALDLRDIYFDARMVRCLLRGLQGRRLGACTNIQISANEVVQEARSDLKAIRTLLKMATSDGGVSPLKFTASTKARAMASGSRARVSSGTYKDAKQNMTHRAKDPKPDKAVTSKLSHMETADHPSVRVPKGGSAKKAPESKREHDDRDNDAKIDGFPALSVTSKKQQHRKGNSGGVFDSYNVANGWTVVRSKRRKTQTVKANAIRAKPLQASMNGITYTLSLSKPTHIGSKLSCDIVLPFNNEIPGVYCSIRREKGSDTLSRLDTAKAVVIERGTQRIKVKRSNLIQCGDRILIDGQSIVVSQRRSPLKALGGTKSVTKTIMSDMPLTVPSLANQTEQDREQRDLKEAIRRSMEDQVAQTSTSSEENHEPCQQQTQDAATTSTSQSPVSDFTKGSTSLRDLFLSAPKMACEPKTTCSSDTKGCVLKWRGSINFIKAGEYATAVCNPTPKHSHNIVRFQVPRSNTNGFASPRAHQLEFVQPDIVSSMKIGSLVDLHVHLDSKGRRKSVLVVPVSSDRTNTSEELRFEMRRRLVGQGLVGTWSAHYTNNFKCTYLISATGVVKLAGKSRWAGGGHRKGVHGWKGGRARVMIQPPHLAASRRDCMPKCTNDQMYEPTYYIGPSERYIPDLSSKAKKEAQSKNRQRWPVWELFRLKSGKDSLDICFFKGLRVFVTGYAHRTDSREPFPEEVERVRREAKAFLRRFRKEQRAKGVKRHLDKGRSPPKATSTDDVEPKNQTTRTHSKVRQVDASILPLEKGQGESISQNGDKKQDLDKPNHSKEARVAVTVSDVEMVAKVSPADFAFAVGRINGVKGCTVAEYKNVKGKDSCGKLEKPSEIKHKSCSPTPDLPTPDLVDPVCSGCYLNCLYDMLLDEQVQERYSQARESIGNERAGAAVFKKNASVRDRLHFKVRIKRIVQSVSTASDIKSLTSRLDEILMQISDQYSYSGECFFVTTLCDAIAGAAENRCFYRNPEVAKPHVLLCASFFTQTNPNGAFIPPFFGSMWARFPLLYPINVPDPSGSTVREQLRALGMDSDEDPDTFYTRQESLMVFYAYVLFDIDQRIHSFDSSLKCSGENTRIAKDKCDFMSVDWLKLFLKQPITLLSAMALDVFLHRNAKLLDDVCGKEFTAIKDCIKTKFIPAARKMNPSQPMALACVNSLERHLKNGW